MQEVAGNQRQIGAGGLALAAALAPCLLAAGCYYPSPSVAPPTSSDGIDAGTDSGTDAGAGSAGSAAETCFGTAPFRVCLAAAPSHPLVLPPGGMVDTAAPSACLDTLPAGSAGCVLAGTTITIDAKLRAFGPRPLVLIASDTLTITGTGSIDVGSHRGAVHELGAGANPDDCVAQEPTNGGGGAGGSFLGHGGTGGDAQLFTEIMQGGTPGPPVDGEITRLRGGCAGQNGGGDGRSRGGYGGGAVLLIAGRAIGLTGGSINAAGEGGEGGRSSPRSAGGGGGSGGMIVFAAPTIASSGLILASGGGGGGGCGASGSGTAGADPSVVSPAAGGGGGPGNGGGGGAGSTSAVDARGSDGSDGHKEEGTALGGGGGGGTGIVKALGAASLDTQQVSPPVQTP